METKLARLGTQRPVWRAWITHAYTALGLVACFMAMRAVLAHQAQEMFIWLGVALFVDGTDGPLARAWDVKRWLPHFDGRKLDDIIDYLTYVFIPIIFIYQFKLVPDVWTPALWLALLASGYGFCVDVAKTDDGMFTGFPSLWNVVAFYLYLLDGMNGFGGPIILVLALLVFAPIKFIAPNIARFGYRLTYFVMALWGVTGLALLVTLDAPAPWLVVVSFACSAYYIGLSLYLNFNPHLLSRR